MFCDFETTETDGAFKHTCRKCGATILSSRPACRMNCKKGGLLVAGLAGAVVKWIAAGSPVRTQEQIDAAFDICKSCEFFKGEGDSGTCQKCGCYVNRVGVLNKIRMATEKCPDGLW